MRRNVSVFILVAAGFAVGTALQGRVTAQASQGPDILPALLVEVRGLRAAMEQMASTGPRVQLALGRLQLQEQRVNNLLRRLEEVRGSLAGTQREEEQARQQVAALEEASKISNEEGRRQAEMELGPTRRSYAAISSELQRLQVEEAGIVQELASEQGRWNDINQRIEELERALTKK
jgi:predicted  nucleic acid-binding Zn-ribbon protein